MSTQPNFGKLNVFSETIQTQWMALFNENNIDIIKQLSILELGTGLGSSAFWITNNLCHHVNECSTEHSYLLMIGNARREAKIDELDILVLIKQYIFKLDIPVCNAFAMAILQSGENLFEYSSGFFFIQLLVYHLFQIRVETSSSYVFHHKVDVGVGFKCFNKFHDVWVVHFLKQDDLTANAPLSIDIG